MNFIYRRPELKHFTDLIRFSSSVKKCYYEVLNINKNSSLKDVKAAFIKKSKEYHPDKNNDKQAQEKFVQVLEAYNILSKPESRAYYDSSMKQSAYNRAPYYPHQQAANRTYNQQYEYPKYTHQAYAARDTNVNHEDFKAKAQVIPNIYVIYTCIAIALVGLMVQAIVIRHSMKITHERASEKSRLIGEELERIKEAAARNGNELQTRLILEKIAEGSRPIVATSTLGHALADSKK